MSLFERLLARLPGVAAAAPLDSDALARACAEALDERLGEHLDGRFAALEEAVSSLADHSQKAARGQSRIALRLEELERKVEGGFAAQAGRLTVRGAQELAGVDDLLDAMDLLDGARAGLGDTTAALREGLAGVLERLGRALAAGGYERHAPVGRSFEARLFRVVGTVDADEHRSDGCVVSVGRAAVTRHGHVIREGEVIVARRQA